MENDSIPVIIPAFQPDERLTALIEELTEDGTGPIILVNDGSGEAFNELFDRAAEMIAHSGGILLEHDHNRGKGAALKTAFKYAVDNFDKKENRLIGVVTADSDGQHTPKDIAAVRDALAASPGHLILGVRDLDGDNVPWKSRVGNNLTKRVFRYAAGMYVSDTQTGLRGIPAALIRPLLDVPGDRYEFETRMLIEAARGGCKIDELTIETVYDSTKNHKTHFDPVKDSLKIYKVLFASFFKYGLSSISSSVIDLGLFTLFNFLLRGRLPGAYIAVSTVAARVISAAYNYTINYKFVFRSRESRAASGGKYFILAVVQMSLSALLVTVLAWCLPVIPDVVIKMIVDTCLFFVSYKIQQKFVF